MEPQTLEIKTGTISTVKIFNEKTVPLKHTIPPETPDLVIFINKPLTWTSFDVVKKIKYGARINKIGHAGTLDPLATGLLIICTGKLTKTIQTIQDTNKEYTGTFTLGATTPCYDLEREVDAYFPTEHITDDLIFATAKEFLGEQLQMPPIYSALKQNGRPIYKKAHKGKEVEVMPRSVRIDEFEITKIEMPIVHFRIVCSSGTYIRSVAHDFGIKLKSGAHLSALCRTKIGEYDLSNALSPSDWVDQYRIQTHMNNTETIDE